MNKKTKEIVKQWKTTFIIGFLVLGLGLFLRLFNLTILPIFTDEAIYIRWAQVMSTEPTLRFLPLSDGKQPFFHWVLMFAVTRFNDPLFVGRLVSVASGMGTILGIFVLTYYLFKSKKTALVASLIWAISPFSVFFDRMALVDSMLAMFGVWTLFLGVLGAKTQRLDVAMLTGFALGFALLTKSPALFFLLMLPLTWVLSDWPKKNKLKLIQLAKLGGLLVVSAVIGLGMYNILRLGPNFHLLSSRTQDYIFPLSHLWTNPKDPFIFFFHRSLQWFWIMGPGTVLVLAGFALVFNIKRYWKESTLLFVWSFLPIAVTSEFAKVITARYILFSVPTLFVIAASIFLAKGNLIRKAAVLGLMIFIFQALVFDQVLLTNPEAAKLPPGERAGYLEEWTAGTGISEVASFIREQHELDPDTQIVVGTEGFFGTLPDGLQAYLQGVDKVVVRGEGLGILEVPSSLLESKAAGNKTYLVANSSRLIFDGDFEDFGLEVIAAYPKAFRREGTRDFLHHGPRDTLYLLEVTNDAI